MEYETYADVIDAYNADNMGYSSLTDYIKDQNIKIKEIEMDPIGDMRRIFESKADGGSIGIEVLFTDKMKNGGRVPAVSGGFLKLLAEGTAKGKKGIMELVESGKGRFDEFVETMNQSKKPSDSFTPQNITADLIDGPITVEKMANLDSKTLDIIKNTYDNGLYKEMPEILKAGNLLERFTKVVKGERIVDYERAESILGVPLKGDETLNEIFKIEFDTRPVEKLADGGRVGLFMGGDPLTGQALSIYDSMNAYGFTDQQIANALEAQGLYGSGSTPASDTPVTNTATNIINRGGDTGGDGGVGGGGGNTLQSFKQDPRVASAFEALERNQQLTSMGINDPFANEASLSGAYYDDMPTDTSNQVGVYQPSIMENIKNKIGGTKIGSMFTGAADKLTNNKFVNALGTAVSFAKSPIVGGAKMLTSGLAGLTNRLPTNQRAITQNIAGNLGIRVDDSGKIRGDYTTPAGVMSGYGLYGIDADTFDNRIDRTTQTLTDKYGFTAKEIEEVIDGTYTGNKGYNKIMGKQTNLIRDLRNINIARGIILNSKELGLKEFDRIEKEKAAAKSRAESAKQYDSSVHGPVNYGLGSDGKQSYDTGLGFGTNATTGGPVSNRTGRGRTDYSRGGLATMFKNKR